jgi:hypothetical protein
MAKRPAEVCCDTTAPYDKERDVSPLTGGQLDFAVRGDHRRPNGFARRDRGRPYRRRRSVPRKAATTAIAATTPTHEAANTRNIHQGRCASGRPVD